MIFMDDIIVFSNIEGGHENHFTDVLGILRMHQLKAKLQSVTFKEGSEVSRSYCFR